MSEEVDLLGMDRAVRRASERANTQRIGANPGAAQRLKKWHDAELESARKLRRLREEGKDWWGQ